jgi:hypothetical protein
MSDFIDPCDPQQVELVMSPALTLLGVPGLLDALSDVLPIRRGRPGGLFRPAEPASVVVGDRVLRIDDDQRASIQHVVGGIVLSQGPVPPADLAGVLAALISRAVKERGTRDAAAVTLTSLRDAVKAGS